MKIGIKLLVCAVLSLSIGIAFASPLLVSELSIRPWVRQVEGQKAEFNVKVAFANFTIQNGSKPVTTNDGPAVSYFVVLNVTNPSDIGAKLWNVEFTAAEKISNISESWSGVVNTIGGNGYFAEGAWVDCIWYNVTLVTGDWSVIDKGNNTGFEPYWIEGVQLLDTYVNGKLDATYMNMNGTWADVTGRINVTRSEQICFSLKRTVVREDHTFANPMPSNDTLGNATDVAKNSTLVVVNGNVTVYFGGDTEPTGIGARSVTYVGEGLFDNYWKPHESRLIVLQGTRDFIKYACDPDGLDALRSGNITLQTRATNFADGVITLANGTWVDTEYIATELKQVQLTQNGDSYIYNTILAENQMFQPDQWGAEVFIKPRS